MTGANTYGPPAPLSTVEETSGSAPRLQARSRHMPAQVRRVLLFLPPVRGLAWRLVRGRIVMHTATSSASWQGARRRPGGRTIDLDAEDYRHEGEPEPDNPPARPVIEDDTRR